MPTDRRLLSLLMAVALLSVPRARAHAFDVVINAQGEFADAYLVNGTASPRIRTASPGRRRVSAGM